MAQSTFSIKVDTSQLEALVEGLGEVTPEALGQRLVEVTNEQIESAYDLSRKRMLSGINLTDGYVKRKMAVTQATANKPVAEIIAYGGREYLTSLSHYGAMQLAKDVTWSNERIASMGKTFGQWPGWVRRKGNAALGIPVNKKAAGRSVEVVRGSRKKIGPAFAIPGKRDNEGNPIVFRRNGADKVEALTGPSVYQLFRVAATALEEQIGDDYQTAITDAAEAELKKVLG